MSMDDGILDLDEIEDIEEYTVVPDGKYHVAVTEVERKAAKDTGNPVWWLKLKILSGEYTGIKIRDSITFTPNALKRVKHVLSVLANCSGKTDLRQINLIGRQAIADIYTEEHVKEANNQKYVSNKVKFNGYSKPDDFQEIAVSDAPPPKPTSNGTGNTPKTSPQPATRQPAATTAAPKGNMPF